MKEIAAELEKAINDYSAKLEMLTEESASLKPAPGKWSRKEVIGHLIDSAQNNLRRFIVGHYETAEITYRQDDWVTINNYQHAELADLLKLWYLLNKQIVSVLKNTPESVAENISRTPGEHTIKWLAKDYIKHLKHHMHQVLDLGAVSYP